MTSTEPKGSQALGNTMKISEDKSVKKEHEDDDSCYHDKRRETQMTSRSTATIAFILPPEMIG